MLPGLKCFLSGGNPNSSDLGIVIPKALNKSRLAVVMGSKINVHAGAHDEQAGTSWPNLALTSAVRH